jgi:hypothetical protein
MAILADIWVSRRARGTLCWHEGALGLRILFNKKIATVFAQFVFAPCVRADTQKIRKCVFRPFPNPGSEGSRVVDLPFFHQGQQIICVDWRFGLCLVQRAQLQNISKQLYAAGKALAQNGLRANLAPMK